MRAIWSSLPARSTAIAATWKVTGAAVTTSASQVYTVPTSNPTYSRDLVVANAGTVSIYAGLSTDGTVATSAAAFKIPAGGSLILTQCQVPTGAVLSVIAGAGSGLVSVGYASLVNFT